MGKMFDSCYEWLNEIKTDCKNGDCTAYLTAYRLGYFECSITGYSGQDRLKREEYKQLHEMADDVYRKYVIEKCVK